MGTIHNQPARHRRKVHLVDIYDEIRKIKDIAMEYDLTFDQVLRVIELLENRRRNDLYVANGDVHDEQMAGLAEAIRGV